MRSLAALLAAALVLTLTGVAGADVWTDKWEYSQGETVQINGDGMAAGETVVVEVFLPDGSLSQSHAVVADELGNFSDAYTIEAGSPGGIYDVVATGQSSGSVYRTQFDPPLTLYKTDTYTTANERTIFPRGATVYARLSGLSGANESKYWRFQVVDANGVARLVSGACTQGSADPVDSYVIQSSDPLSENGATWTYRGIRYDDSGCTTNASVAQLASFYVAHTWAFGSTASRDLCTNEATCEANDKPYWKPGSDTIYLRTRGLELSPAEYNPDWLTPGNAVFCQNAKTASTATGVLDLNLCATPTVGANEGQWRLLLEFQSGNADQVSRRSVTTKSFILDATLPDSAITFPAHGGSYGVATWDPACDSAGGDICGTATDPESAGVSSGVNKVEVSIKQENNIALATDDKWWDGDSFDATSETFFTTTLDTAVTPNKWSYAFSSANFPSTGSYTIRSRATDNAGNVETSLASNTFTFTVPAASVYDLVFHRPMDPWDGSVINSIKNGRVIPIKVEIFLDNVELESGTFTIRVTGITCPGNGTADPAEEYADAGSSNGNTAVFRWSATDPGLWIYNLDTKALGLLVNKCYRVDVYDGTTHLSTDDYVVIKVIK